MTVRAISIESRRVAAFVANVSILSYVYVTNRSKVSTGGTLLQGFAGWMSHYGNCTLGQCNGTCYDPKCMLENFTL